MTTPLLKQLANYYFKENNDNLNKFTFVFPNKRAGLFFRKHLSEMSDSPIWAPQTISINEFILSLSPLHLLDNTALLFELYEVYCTLNSNAETFDEFYYWGEIILSDFDDIDKYNIHAEQLFNNITDLKEIDYHYNYLGEEQIAAIRTFWSNFNPVNSENKERFLTTWRILLPLYQTLRKKLLNMNKGYEGMIYRSIAEQIAEQKDLLKDTPYQQLVFCGFNALTTTEHLLFKHLKEWKCADFYWDYLDVFVNDMQNKAYQFIRQNKLLFPSKYNLENTQQLNSKAIEIISLSSTTGMAQEAGKLLETLNEEETALVLADENLLIPCLYALPEEIKKINITMGYPLKNSGIYQLIHLLIDLYEKIRRSRNGNAYFYHKQVLAVIRHKIIAQLLTAEEQHLCNQIIKENLIQVPVEYFAHTPLLGEIFRTCKHAMEFSFYLENLIKTIQRLNEPSALDALDKEFNFHFFTSNQRLRDLFENHGCDLEIKTYASILRKQMDHIIVPFEGEPLCGLQILGVLETRNIDFKNLIITSMNEGVFPKHAQQASFIPHNLRRGFELPTSELQDRIFSYYFHRLISRAEKIWILYDTRNEGIRSGEASRYCHLLKYEYASKWPTHIQLKERNVSLMPQLKTATPFEVHKTNQNLLLLEAYKRGGARFLSASAIITHINCSMQFYLKYLKNIREQDEINEDIDPAMLGTVYHNTMEKIYAPLENEIVSSEYLNGLLSKNKKHIKQLVEDTFSSYTNPLNKQNQTLRGRDYIVLNIIEKYVIRTIKFDIESTPFTYLKGEKHLKETFIINEDLHVQLQGYIDRLDQKEHIIRIIDYKTGQATLQTNELETLFDGEKSARANAVFQTLFYTLLLHLEGKYALQLQPHVYVLRNMFSESFDSQIKINKIRVDNFELYRTNFEHLLKVHLENLFNPNIPFKQSSNNDNCLYCEFKKLCNR